MPGAVWPLAPHWPPATRSGPALCGQLLVYPMLDDRGRTPSTGQFDGVGVWDRISNETIWWAAVLGDRYGSTMSRPISPLLALPT